MVIWPSPNPELTTLGSIPARVWPLFVARCEQESMNSRGLARFILVHSIGDFFVRSSHLDRIPGHIRQCLLNPREQSLRAAWRPTSGDARYLIRGNLVARLCVVSCTYIYTDTHTYTCAARWDQAVWSCCRSVAGWWFKQRWNAPSFHSVVFISSCNVWLWRR